MASGHMTPEEREAFLADVHVGILAVVEPGRGPFALPIWYRYVDGRVEMGMDGSSLKARLLRQAGRATLTVQTETPPYKFASVEGPVEVVAERRDDLEMATRYLGTELGSGTPRTTPAPRPPWWRCSSPSTGERSTSPR